MKQINGIYVEIHIKDTVDHLWKLTQQPDLHQRWDLRFPQIQYLPRPNRNEPQRFLYETRIGFGLKTEGTGQSMGQPASETGERSSSLQFASDDPKSFIRQGSGYWCYVPTEGGLRFFTWYDYEVRFGILGRLVNKLLLQPLMGWATAWSFDRLRLWVERGQSPELSMNLALLHATARFALAAIWIWHGLVPKLLYRNRDETAMLAQAGLPLGLLPFIGVAEIAFGLLFILLWRRSSLFFVSMLLMVFATIGILIYSPAYLSAAFNPVTLNLSVFALSIVGWLSLKDLPTASTCLREPPEKQA
ncbi:DoxX-like family protein [Bryobacter aggregatus]|uniref:DoxX-like family protein n=1 Tax=Bryobacter aggregatus TaxID=360054 RepID=UPI0004E20541|nr:DoxX-like family protein [Bryobacter aggregatus]